MGKNKIWKDLEKIDIDNRHNTENKSILLSPAINEGTLTIDGKAIEFTPADINLVEVARKAKITIPAPCYHAKTKHGCCRACLVEINGTQKYACSTLPLEGMKIIVNRADLKRIRKERIFRYKKRISWESP